MDINILTILFFLVAIIYSMVGFGGGSSYVALLVIFATSYDEIPIIALVCNLIVVSSGVIHFSRAGYFNKSLLIPFLISSIPMAFFGGMIPISKNIFQLILGICLSLAGIRLIFYQKKVYEVIKTPTLTNSLGLGGLLGLVSGLVGIGGGIFLSPIMHIFRWGKPKEIASVAAFFIFFNSIAGLFGQILKSGNIGQILNYSPLLVAVLLGGQIGSALGSYKIASRKIELVTGLLVLMVSIRLILNVTTSFATN